MGKMLVMSPMNKNKMQDNNGEDLKMENRPLLHEPEGNSNGFTLRFLRLRKCCFISKSLCSCSICKNREALTAHVKSAHRVEIHQELKYRGPFNNS